MSGGSLRLDSASVLLEMTQTVCMCMTHCGIEFIDTFQTKRQRFEIIENSKTDSSRCSAGEISGRQALEQQVLTGFNDKLHVLLEEPVFGVERVVLHESL